MTYRNVDWMWVFSPSSLTPTMQVFNGGKGVHARERVKGVVERFVVCGVIPVVPVFVRGGSVTQSYVRDVVQSE